MNRLNWLFAFLALLLAPAGVGFAQEPLVLVVMDPLSLPLSCDCVRGYAQRDYNVLAKHLEQSLDRTVKVVWFESLTDALQKTDGKADLIIGKHSVVLADAKEASLKLCPLASLTGQEGEVSQTGLIVVRRQDPAQHLSDLQGYRIFLGPESAAEKASAVEAALKKSGVKLGDKRERCEACSEAAAKLLRLPADEKAAAVISSYAQPLLVGCGSIEKGDLRVVGETAAIPFISAFVRDQIDPAERGKVLDALVAASEDEEVLKRLETLIGFVKWEAASNNSAAEKENPATTVNDPSRDQTIVVPVLPQSGSGWPQFRGPSRDGRVDWLPSRLPDLEKDLAWSIQLSSDGLGGVMATDKMVVIGYRDTSDRRDCFSACELANGEQLWTYEYDAKADLDYGNTPRATPIYSEGVVVTLGATGVLSALDAESGVAIWTICVTEQFDMQSPTWGFCGSPLVVDDSIYMQAGPDGAVVAIDLFSGETKWQASGNRTAYASLIPWMEKKLLLGVDDKGYFARRRADGKLVWSHRPKYPGDFGVPSPVPAGDSVVFTGENNGMVRFTNLGDIASSKPDAVNDSLIPDMHTPVCVGDKLLVAFEGLRALNINKMTESWSLAEDEVSGYASIIASEDRALVTTEQGQLLLLDIKSSTGRILDQCHLTDKRIRILSHPAVSHGRLLLRVGKELRCYKMSRNSGDQTSIVSTSGDSSAFWDPTHKEQIESTSTYRITCPGLPATLWNSVAVPLGNQSIESAKTSLIYRYGSNKEDVKNAKGKQQKEEAGRLRNFEGEPVVFSVCAPAEIEPGEPLGLLVYISPHQAALDADFGHRFNYAVDERRMVTIVANRAGNHDSTAWRVMCAVAAVDLAKRRYNIQSERVYVSGASGGGRVTSYVMLRFPEIFTGAMPICGMYPLSVWEPANIPPETLSRFYSSTRLAVLEGKADFNREESKEIFDFYEPKMAMATYIEDPNAGHGVHDPKYLDEALDFLDGPLSINEP